MTRGRPSSWTLLLSETLLLVGVTASDAKAGADVAIGCRSVFLGANLTAVVDTYTAEDVTFTCAQIHTHEADIEEKFFI